MPYWICTQSKHDAAYLGLGELLAGEAADESTGADSRAAEPLCYCEPISTSSDLNVSATVLARL